jgi:hypothetical protein
MHRVVLFRGTGRIPELPFSAIDSSRPEDLWDWMDDVRATGTPLLAVPHNGNASDGIMFAVEESFGGSALNLQYAQARMRNEPLYEITQIKGTSETHPVLAPNDEFASFELWDYTIAPGGRRPDPSSRPGSYVRDAFKRGLQLEAAGNGNPFKYGVIGDSDTHNAASSIEEDNYTGKFGVERDRDHRLNGIPGYPDTENQQVREFSSGGVAGVWAEANTREAIFAAMQRRETFATSAPRMRVRAFAGYGFDQTALEGADWIERAYAGGVPMGGDLGSGDGAPSLLIWANKEADGANLDRIQVGRPRQLSGGTLGPCSPRSGGQQDRLVRLPRQCAPEPLGQRMLLIVGQGRQVGGRGARPAVKRTPEVIEIPEMSGHLQ